jgi:hypothetical protein
MQEKKCNHVFRAVTTSALVCGHVVGSSTDIELTQNKTTILICIISPIQVPLHRAATLARQGKANGCGIQIFQVLPQT